MIRKVYEVDLLLCPQCGGKMRVIAFLTNEAVVDRIVDLLKLNVGAERPPPAHLVPQEFFINAEPPRIPSYNLLFEPEERSR
jgi:PHP family Zn ribbon phosphoesterase